MGKWRIEHVVLLLTGAAVSAVLLLLAKNAVEGSTVAISAAAEANQGLLSFAALALALVVALFEHIRANAAEGQRRREFIEMLCGLVDEIDRLAACNIPTDQKSLNSRYNDWNELIVRTGEVINATRSAAAPDAKLALLVQQLADEMPKARVYVFDGALMRSSFDEAATRLRAIRERIKSRADR